ncbi:MAG: hypothetical protein JO112_18810 [Planctomycetes bacterium]|nr:hypothetical protein [Planctomycetota bacterium]
MGTRRYLLNGDVLYEGYDAGEWGGDLLVLDLRTGEWKKIDYQGQCPYHLPVRDMQVGPGGVIWVVEGLAHLGESEGSLWVDQGGDWKRFASTERFSERTATPWELPPSSMDGIAFGEDGALWMLAEDLGVVRYDGTAWKQLTRGWPGGQYVSCFCLTPNWVAVGMLDAGVLLWDLRSNTVRRVPLRIPGEPAPPGRGGLNRVRLW